MLSASGGSANTNVACRKPLESSYYPPAATVSGPADPGREGCAGFAVKCALCDDRRFAATVAFIAPP
jgi:hypothetical protein